MTAADYGAELAALGGALTGWRRSERQAAAGPDPSGGPGGDQDGDSPAGDGRGGRKSSNNGVSALCGCEPPRRIRVAVSVLDAGPVVCGLCDAEFAAA